MFFLRYVLRVVRARRLQSVCTGATVLISSLLVLTLLASARILGGIDSADTTSHLVIVASRAAPFVGLLPRNIEQKVAQVTGVEEVAPMAISAVQIGNDRLPSALVLTEAERYLQIYGQVIRKDTGASDSSIDRGAIIGRKLALSHGLHINDQLRFRFVNSLTPSKVPSFDVRISGIYQDSSNRSGEGQVVLDLDRFGDALLLDPGMVSAFAVSVKPTRSRATTAFAIDRMAYGTAYPTKTGDASVVAATLISKFVDVRLLLSSIGVISIVAFFVVLVGAAGSLILSYGRDRRVFIGLGFSERLVGMLGLAQWAVASLSGLVVGAIQISVVIVVMKAKHIDFALGLLPEAREVFIATGISLSVSLVAYVVAWTALSSRWATGWQSSHG